MEGRQREVEADRRQKMRGDSKRREGVKGKMTGGEGVHGGPHGVLLRDSFRKWETLSKLSIVLAGDH